MNQNRYSRQALAGFLIPFLVELAVLVCSATIPKNQLDSSLGSMIGIAGFAFLTFSFLLCGRAIRSIRASNGQLKGFALARIGQFLPIAILILTTVAYNVRLRSRGSD